jgi:hypothetical protein
MRNRLDGLDSRSRFDRRAAFFAGAAVLCALLYPVAGPEFRWVCVALAIIYVLLAVASFLDSLGRSSL